MCIDDKKVHYKRGYYGNNKYEIPFIDSKREGVAKWYYVNGNIKQEVPYIQDQIHGIGTIYYENGKIEAEIPYSHDKRDGIAKRYDEDGNIVQEVSFSNDRKDGMTKWYYPNGSTLIEIFDENDATTHIKLFYTNGNLVIKADLYSDLPRIGLICKRLDVSCFEDNIDDVRRYDNRTVFYNTFAFPSIHELVLDNVIIYNTSGTILLELTKDSQKLNGNTLQTAVKNHIKGPQGDTWLDEINTVHKFVDALFDKEIGVVNDSNNSLFIGNIGNKAGDCLLELGKRLHSLFEEISNIANNVIESYRQCPL